MHFENVKLVKKANVYDNGKVASRTFYLAGGERKTLGFMQAGEYAFSTGAAEIMEMLSGEMEALLPGESSYRLYKEGESFSIPANSSFKVKVANYADYCCSYAD